MSRLRRIVSSNVAALAAQQATVVIAGLGLQIYLARKLTKADFGTIAFVASIMAMVTFLAHMRINILVTREVARDPESAPNWMSRGQLATLLLAPIAGTVAVLWVYLQDGRPEVVFAALLAAIALGLNGMALIPEAVLTGLRRMSSLVPAWIIGRLVLVIVTVFAVEAGGTVVAVYAGQIASFAVIATILWLTVRRMIGPWAFAVPLDQVKTIVRDSLPFAGIALFSSVYVLSDVIILEYMRGEEEVAVYRVASLAVVHLPMLSMIVVRSFYPRMSALVGQPKVAGEELTFAIRVLLVMSLPMCVGGMLVAEPLITTVVDSRYAVAALPMLWLLPMVPLRFVNNITGMTMMALDMQTHRARGLAMASVLNVGLNIWLIPHYGAAAAAATTLMADIFLLFYYGYMANKVATGAQYLRPVLHIAPALVGMAAVVLATPMLHVLLRVALGGLVYVAIVFGTGVVKRAELGRLVRV